MTPRKGWELGIRGQGGGRGEGLDGDRGNGQARDRAGNQEETQRGFFGAPLPSTMRGLSRIGANAPLGAGLTPREVLSHTDEAIS